MYSKGLNFEFCMLDTANPCSEAVLRLGGGYNSLFIRLLTALCKFAITSQESEVMLWH